MTDTGEKMDEPDMFGHTLSLYKGGIINPRILEYDKTVIKYYVW